MTATMTTTKSPVTSARTASESRIDADSHFNGLYESKQDLRIEGIAEGEIQCEGTLTVAEGAQVKAKVTAKTITIAGDLEGEVVCRSVFQILPTGQVQASVSARRLIVQEGGVYNGEFHMITDETAFAIPAADPDPDQHGSPEGSNKPSDRVTALDSREWWAKMIGETPATDGPEAKPA